MPLDAEQTRKVYLYTGHLQVNRTGVFLGGLPESTESTHILQTSIDNLTANGIATVIALLVTLDGLYADLFSIRTRFQAEVAGKITLNAKEWDDRMVQWNFFREQLARTLDVALDPTSAADNGGGSSGIQGPWREP